MRKFLIVDGNSIINRAFYGIRLLSNARGVYTNALVGFLNILSRIEEEEHADGVGVCFDLKAPTFRHELYDGYKAGRRPMPEELAMQLPLLKEILDGLRIPRFELAGWEADDLLGTLSARIAAQGDVCVLVTGDRDSFQLVGDGTLLCYVTTRQGRPETVRYDPLRIQLDYGIEPAQFVDVKALMGDQSDNIPGVKGIGEKTALELIRRFSDLDALYASLGSADLRDSVRAKLAEGRESAYLSRTLARIARDVPVAFRTEELLTRAPDNDRLYRLLDDLEMQSAIKKLGLVPPAPPAAAAETAAPARRVVEGSPDRFAALSGEVGFAADFDAHRLAAAFGGTVLAADFGPLDPDGFREALAAVAASGATLCCASAKPLERFCLENGLAVPAVGFDAGLAAQLCEENAGLADLCRKLLGREPAGADNPAAAEADAALSLRPVLEEKLAQNGLTRLYRDVELPLAEVLAAMETEGFLLDREGLRGFGDELDARIAQSAAEVYRLAGHEFNISSPRQLGTVLFDELQLRHGKKTKTGWSTNADVLKKLDGEPIVAAVLAYRGYAKLKSTYVDGLLRAVGPDGRVHTTFSQLGAVTGRLSSSEPNLQNIPVRSEPGSRMREFFIAPPGRVLIDADYSQIELRVLAHVAGDEAMIRDFSAGADIHRATAAQVFGVPPEEVTPRQRSFSKAVNFGIVYGISDFSLADDLGIPRKDAREMIDRYLEHYAGVRRYMTDVVAAARESGFVTTLFGRRRALPDLRSSNFNIRSAAERMAMNAPIQGTAADVIKLAMVAIFRRLRQTHPDAHLILQVHDELLVECPEAEAEDVRLLLEEEMRGVARLSVELAADAGVGRSWAEAKH